VDPLERLRHSGQAAGAAHVVGQGVVVEVDHGETLGDRLLDAPRGQLGGRGVDRDDAAGEPGVLGRPVLALHRLEDGMLQLELAAELADLAGEQADGLRGELLLTPPLLEERQGEAPGAVGDHDLGAHLLATRPERTVHGADDARHDGRVLADLQRRQVAQLADSDVAAGIVAQQVVDHGHLEGGLQYLRGLVAHDGAQPGGRLDHHSTATNKG
jgi:hypothetical protein